MSHRSRLIWRCRRGMKEMDILFEKFMNNSYDNLSKEEQVHFEEFLNETDSDINDWILDRAIPDNSEYIPFINYLKTCL
jgi:antitoxin CptB